MCFVKAYLYDLEDFKSMKIVEKLDLYFLGKYCSIILWIYHREKYYSIWILISDEMNHIILLESSNA